MLTVHSKAAHRSIDSLRSQSRASAGEARAESLWLVCTDAVMDRALERIRATESPLVLRSFGGAFSGDVAMHDQQLTAIEYAVEQLGVHDVVVCGHSMCACVPAGPETRRRSSGGADALLSGVRRREARNERGRRLVIEQVNMLQALPAVVGAISRRQLRVHGVFYLVESGLFTRYDRGSGEFLPLHL